MMLPTRFVAPFRGQLEISSKIFNEGKANRVEGVFLWPAIERKSLSAAKEWVWKYVYLSAKLSVDLRTCLVRRRYLDGVLQRHLKHAMLRSSCRGKAEKRVKK
jgi:hypothetical protein